MIITFVLAMVFMIFGICVKKFQLANILTYYEPEKHKPFKKTISNHAGNFFIVLSVILCILALLSYYLPNVPYYIFIIIFVVVFFIGAIFVPVYSLLRIDKQIKH